MRSDAEGGGEGHLPATLSSLIEALGGGLIEVVTAPRGLDVAVASPVIFDRAGGLSVATDDLVLAVGIGPDTPDAIEMVDLARAAGAAAVIVKLTDRPPARLVHAAESAGLALLAVPVATSWGQLFTLLHTAREASRALTRPNGAGIAIGDLFALANAVAAMVGGATTIEDLDSNVLAFSSLEQPIDKPRQDTILGRKVPGPWKRALEHQGVFKLLYASDDVVHLDDVPESPAELSRRLAVSIRAGGELLGSIWVVEGERSLDAAAEEALRGAARIAALHMLHHRARADLERQRRGELLRLLLNGVGPPSAITALGLAPGTLLTVIAFAPDRTEIAEGRLTIERLVGLINLYAEVYRRRASAVAIGEVVYLLLPTPESLSRSRLLGLAGDLIERITTAVKVPVRAGVGSAVREPGAVKCSRHEADQVLRVLLKRGDGAHLGHADDLRAHLALLYLEDLAAQEPILRAGKVQRLVEHDARRGTCHVETLRVFLDCFGQVPAAAAALKIHRNTFRYRLARLLEISRIDLSDPEERLITHLQLSLLRAGVPQ